MTRDWSMLDFGLHQGLGLQSHAPREDLRLLAMVSTPDANGGLETLWQLCLHLQHLGYPVVVLDGTASETAHSPGLQDLLAQPAWADGLRTDDRTGAGTLAVLPAQQGLQILARHNAPPAQALQRLHPWLRHYALVVLYAPLDVLASPLLEGSMATPLVLMQPGHTGVIDSYRQLKLLALHAGLSGLVACLGRSYPAQAQRLAQESLESLRRCAARHLGQQPRTTLIRADRPQELQRLALQWLENACTLTAPMDQCALPLTYPQGTPAHFAQSH